MAIPFIRVDISAAMAGLQDIRTNQIPYVTSRALNDCADKAVSDMADWVKSIFNFRGGSQWVKWRWFHSKWSNKYDLRAYVEGMMGYLIFHEEGGIRRPYSKPTLAIPLGNLKTRRIPPQLRPSYLMGTDFQALLKSASLKPRSRKKQISQFGKAFVLVLGGRRYLAMKGTNAGLPLTPRMKGVNLLYHLVPSVKAIPRLKMVMNVRNTVQREFVGAFRRRLAEALPRR